MIKPYGKRFKLDERPFGSSGPRIVKVFDTRKEAKQYRLDYISSMGVHDHDTRKLSDLVDQWYEYHGVNLRDARYRYSRLHAVCARLGNPYASMFKTADFTRYRSKRLRVVSAETVNHETRYFRALFNTLSSLGLWSFDNPMSGIRILPIAERELSYLDDDQIRVLLSSCKSSNSVHLEAVVRLCLNTGARWNEANTLRHSDLMADRVRFVATKNGKVRVVPISPVFSDWLRSVAIPKPSDRLFFDCRSAFRRAVKKSAIRLPRGQLTHVLRHTYASHFVMQGGDIRLLQQVLGHSDIKITQRYSHLSPDYFNGAREFVPKVVRMW